MDFINYVNEGRAVKDDKEIKTDDPVRVCSIESGVGHLLAFSHPRLWAEVKQQVLVMAVTDTIITM